ncbi:MAG: MFS transporter [Acidimicrobiia bacterium]|nr:MFS transporter [Acidimicrobiales bacterium]
MSETHDRGALDASLLHPSDPHTDDEAVGDARRRQRVLIIMCLALAGVIASVSGLNVALQQLAADLGASQSQLLWIINGYTLALAALLMPVGAIGDRWGRKPVLLAGLGVFGAPTSPSCDSFARGARRAAGTGPGGSVDDHAGDAVGDHHQLPR